MINPLITALARTTLLTLQSFKKEELPSQLNELFEEHNVYQWLWENNYITINNDRIEQKLQIIQGEKIWKIIKKELEKKYNLKEVNLQCKNRFSPKATTESLLSNLLKKHDIATVIKALDNALSVQKGVYTYLSGLDVYLKEDRFESLLELNSDKEEFKWS